MESESSQKRTPRPMRPMEATVSPMTDPPKNATLRAAAAPCSLAAIVVRTFALVAVYMPTNPANEDAMQPNRKAPAWYLPYSGFCKKNSAAAMTTAKREMSMNSRFMNTMAPRWIFSAISATLPSPPDFLTIEASMIPAMIRPMRPTIGVRMYISDIGFCVLFGFG